MLDALIRDRVMGAVQAHPAALMNSGVKKGRPWMWSQWLWVMKMFAFTGSLVSRCWASGNRPVPPSRMSRVSSSVRTSMQVVLPP